METADREWLETKREFRYVLMRAARLVGQVVFYISLAVVFLGLVLFLLSLPNVIIWMVTLGKEIGVMELPGKYHPLLYCLAGSVVLSIGFFGIALGTGATAPYQWATEMPSSHVRICKACGKPLPKEWIIHRCQGCGKILPMGVATYLVRLASKAITITHLMIALILILFLFR
jgi:hypothetical protein